jgi:iron complex outermembrane recepter protein
MKKQRAAYIACASLFWSVSSCLLPGVGCAADSVQVMPEVSVTGTREQQLLTETPAAVGVVRGETVRQDKPSHPSQVMGQVPGVAVNVTNGEGHTTAIRQPFTTNPVYLFLEDGIPVRSTGFFNHNALYEINIPQSGGFEVTRGPGTALYGSDAIGGIINVLTRTPPRGREIYGSGEIGQFGWKRLLFGGGNSYARDAWRGDLNLTHTDGWRETTAYDRQSGTLRWDRTLGSDAMLKTVVSFSHINQQTGANSPLVYDDYINNPKRNYLPIAFRKVEAFRLSTNYEKEIGNSLLSLTPYLRDNTMDLLASFLLNSDPTVATTQNRSYGLLAKWRTDFPDWMRARVIVGADIDVSPGGREEDRLNVNTTGSGASRVFSSYTTGPRVYDYDVTFRGVSPYIHGEISPTDRLRIVAGVRYDHLSYRFENHIAGAPIAVPGAFPGLRFYGQADSTDVTFEHVSPKIGATYRLAADTHVFAAYNHGFRAPSEGQLFRPSAGTTAAAAQTFVQSALALKPIKADQFELGVRGTVAGVASYDVVAYDLRKRDDILTSRDTTTNFTQIVNAGRTRHRGIEVGAGAPILKAVRFDVAFSYAKHTYEDWVSAQGNFTGKEIEFAPRVISNTRLTWLPSAGRRLQLEWVRIGAYWLDAANTGKYGGHDLFNLRGNYQFSKGVSFFGSIANIFDKRYAESASISSATPVYSPGLPRTLYAGAELTW